MNLAKVTANGQITVPVELRRMLKLKPGDKVLFVINDRGEVVLSNASEQALRKAQSAFAGVAEAIGVSNEDQVQDLVNEVRHKKTA